MPRGVLLMMRSLWMALLLVGLSSPAFAAPFIFPTDVDIAVGQTRNISVSVPWFWYGGEQVRVEALNPSPSIASVSRLTVETDNSSYPFRVAVIRFSLTGISVGYVVIDVTYDTLLTSRYFVVVEPCDHFPKIPPLTWVRGQIDEPVYIFSHVITANDAPLFEWYAGFTGDTGGGIVSTGNALSFTPREPRQYRFWYRVIDKCATGTGEAVIDASEVPPRRHSVKR